MSIKPPSVFQPLARRIIGLFTGHSRHFRLNKINHLRNEETTETRRMWRFFVLGNQLVVDGHIHEKRSFCGVCAGCPVILSIAKNLFLQRFHRSFASLRMTGRASATGPKRPFWRQIGVRNIAGLRREKTVNQRAICGPWPGFGIWAFDRAQARCSGFGSCSPPNPESRVPNPESPVPSPQPQ